MPRKRKNENRFAWNLVVIDHVPIRRNAAAECTAAMARLAELKAVWNRFEREDKPSFVRWRAREFGPLLSELREVEERIRDDEALVHEVEMEMRRGFYDPQTAYQRVRFRRENPGIVADTPQPRSQRRAGEEPKLTEFEQEALFQDWVRKFIGTNPDKLDDKAYSTTFDAFKSHMFRSRPSEPPPSQNFRRAEQERRRPLEEEPAAPAIDPRVKELYRLLVRRLHPDLRADGSAHVSALWHEVQEAYAATDIAHLEILLALSDIESDRFTDQTSVAQMRAVYAELERALFALDDSLRAARNENAWNFARAGAGADLRSEVERELQANLRRRSERLTLLRQTIAAWSRPPRTAAAAIG
jgi:stress-induced morphogen